MMLKFFRSLGLAVIVLVGFAMVSCSNDRDDTALQAPVLSEASGITSTNFIITWEPVVHAEIYLLDISTSSTFATQVPGYNKKQVTGIQSFVQQDFVVLSTEAMGLAANTKYYFRLYSRNGNTTSAASAVKEVTTAAAAN